MGCVDYLHSDFKNTGNCLMECNFPRAIIVFQFSAYIFKSISFMSWAVTHTGKWALKLGLKCRRKECQGRVLGWGKLECVGIALGHLWEPEQGGFSRKTFGIPPGALWSSALSNSSTDIVQLVRCQCAAWILQTWGETWDFLVHPSPFQGRAFLAHWHF